MEHEEVNRKMVFIGAIFLNALLLLLVIFNPQADASLPSYWLGLFIGITLGILSCLDLRAVWDPVQLKLRNPKARTADLRWMPIVVIGSIIAAKLSANFMGPEIETALANGAVTFGIVTLGYMTFQAWWHRPRS